MAQERGHTATRAPVIVYVSVFQALFQPVCLCVYLFLSICAFLSICVDLLLYFSIAVSTFT